MKTSNKIHAISKIPIGIRQPAHIQHYSDTEQDEIEDMGSSPSKSPQLRKKSSVLKHPQQQLKQPIIKPRQSISHEEEPHSQPTIKRLSNKLIVKSNVLARLDEQNHSEQEQEEKEEPMITYESPDFNNNNNDDSSGKTKPNSMIIARQDQILTAMFNWLDVNASGVLTPKELELLEDMLLTPSNEYLDVKQLFSQSESETFRLQEFKEILRPHVILILGRSDHPKSFYDSVDWKRQIADSWQMWIAAQKFTFDYSIALLLLFFQLFVLIAAKLLSRQDIIQNTVASYTILVISLAIVIYLIGHATLPDHHKLLIRYNNLELNSDNSSHEKNKMQTKNSLVIRKKWHLYILSIGYVFVVIELAICVFFFRMDPFAAAGHSETVWAFSVNLLSSLAVGIMTIKYASYEWKLAEDRDLSLLSRDQLSNNNQQDIAEEEKKMTAYDLFQSIRMECRKRRKSQMESSKKRIVWMILRSFVGAFIYLYVELLADKWEITADLKRGSPDIFRARFQRQSLLDFISSDIAYILMVCSSTAAFFFSTCGLEMAIYHYAHLPFLKNKILKELLYDILHPSQSAIKSLPYCPLFTRENIKAYMSVESFIRLNDLMKDVGQATAGFASIFIVNVFLIAAILFIYVFEQNWKGVVVPLFYAALSTLWCIKLVGMAVDINEGQEVLVRRIGEYQSQARLLEDDAKDSLKYPPEKIYEMLEELKHSLQVNFKPVSILGVAASPALATAFFGYLISAVVAIVGKNILNIDIGG